MKVNYILAIFPNYAWSKSPPHNKLHQAQRFNKIYVNKCMEYCWKVKKTPKTPNPLFHKQGSLVHLTITELHQNQPARCRNSTTNEGCCSREPAAESNTNIRISPQCAFQNTQVFPAFGNLCTESTPVRHTGDWTTDLLRNTRSNSSIPQTCLDKCSALNSQ